MQLTLIPVAMTVESKQENKEVFFISGVTHLASLLSVSATVQLALSCLDVCCVPVHQVLTTLLWTQASMV